MKILIVEVTFYGFNYRIFFMCVSHFSNLKSVWSKFLTFLNYSQSLAIRPNSKNALNNIYIKHK